MLIRNVLIVEIYKIQQLDIATDTNGNQVVKLQISLKYITLYRDDDMAKTLSSAHKKMFGIVFLVLKTE